MAPHSSTLAWKNPMDGGAWWAAVHGVSKSQTWLSTFTFTFHFHALEKEVATHSRALAWRIPGMAEPDGLPSMGSHRVRHDWIDLAAAAAYVICIHSSVNGQFGSSHVLAIVIVLQWTSDCIYLFKLWFSPDIYPAMGLQGHIVTLVLVF